MEQLKEDLEKLNEKDEEGELELLLYVYKKYPPKKKAHKLSAAKIKKAYDNPKKAFQVNQTLSTSGHYLCDPQGY